MPRRRRPGRGRRERRLAALQPARLARETSLCHQRVRAIGRLTIRHASRALPLEGAKWHIATRDTERSATVSASARVAQLDAASVRALLPATLELRETHEYVRFFSYALDTALNAASGRATPATSGRTAKGAIPLNSRDLGQVSGAVRMMYPFMRAFAALDALLPFTHGYMPVSYTHLTLPTKRIV